MAGGDSFDRRYGIGIETVQFAEVAGKGLFYTLYMEAEMRASILLLLVGAALPHRANGQSEYEALSETANRQVLVSRTRLLRNKFVTKELEILPAQIEALEDGIAEAEQAYKTILAEAKKHRERTGDAQGYSEKCEAAFDDYSREWERVLAEVLLPHQHEQLNRTVLWSMIAKLHGKNKEIPYVNHVNRHEQRTPLFRSVLEHSVVQEMAGVDVSQARQLNEQAHRLEAEYVKELAALQDKYEAKLRESLRPEQREKLERLLGETPAFYFQ